MAESENSIAEGGTAAQPQPQPDDAPPLSTPDPVQVRTGTVRHGAGWAQAAMLIALPPLVYYLWICVHFHDGALVLPRSLAELRRLLSLVPGPTATAALLYGGWIALQALLQIYAPGRTKEGAPLPDGTRLPYRLNGWAALLITLALSVGLVRTGLVPATLLADQLGPLLTVANLFTFGLSLYVYLLGRRQERDGAPPRPIHDYVMGSALNPRDGAFDWKFFCESRPGLMLWLLIDLSLLFKQQALIGRVTTPMILVCAFQVLYVIDYFYHEEAILTTWDIRHERFGWMLCWGSLVWVPFTYTLQAQYLLAHTHDLPAWATVGIVALNLLGFYLFRAANLQKHRFRSDPEGAIIWGKKAEAMRTAQGSLLLTSGLWGLARHMNYTGDLIMGLAWCLPCLFAHPLPYFYFIYFAALLIHRERRDHDRCQARYGADWDAYCSKVRYRMIPGVY
jgi:protein-S-isoprenylcysteine O-methyltransferase Ste14